MKTFNHRSIALAAVAALGVATFAVRAHADEADVRLPARTVHYADLNLNTRAGADKFHQRIRGAAEQVCGDVWSRQLAEAMTARACVDRAVAAGTRAVRLASAH